jgi:hypothetical protein
MRFLGHKNIANTLIYTQLVELEGDEYNSAVANSVEEARASDDFNNCRQVCLAAKLYK